MKDNLKITMVQLDIFWEAPEKNRKRLDEILPEKGATDLIILPEMFTTGFSMNPEKLYETMDGPSVEWMKEKARSLDAAITGSLIIKEGSNMYNRCLWVTPDGDLQTYDKRHLYTMGEEDKHYTAGKSKLITEYKGWRICPLICYDLRFPVWSRNNADYDLLIFMANWPSPRHHVWENLLKARAIENQSYCVGVNRTGNDGTGLSYLGGSVVIDAKGFGEFLNKKEQVKTFELPLSDLTSFRNKFPLLPDRDQFTILDN